MTRAELDQLLARNPQLNVDGEVRASHLDDPEKVIQANFAIACRDRGWRPVWHRTDKRSTANRGCPDFIVAAKGQTFWIEIKKPGCSLAPDQITFKLQLAHNGVTMFTAYSAAEAVALIEKS